MTDKKKKQKIQSENYSLLNMKAGAIKKGETNAGKNERDEVKTKNCGSCGGYFAVMHQCGNQLGAYSLTAVKWR